MRLKTSLTLPVLLAALLVLPGCVGLIMADATRKELLSAISRVMAEEQPTLDSDAAGKCVLKAMTIPEIGVLGVKDNYRRVSDTSRANILTYAARPEAVACLGALKPTEPENA